MEDVYSWRDSLLELLHKMHLLLGLYDQRLEESLTHRSILSTGLGGHVDVRFFDQHLDSLSVKLPVSCGNWIKPIVYKQSRQISRKEEKEVVKTLKVDKSSK
jgi:hypothetical protein